MNDGDKRRDMLLEMLQQHFQGAGSLLSDLSPSADLSARLWEPALLAPLREFLRRPGKEFRARVVATSWALASGGERDMPASLPMIVELLHAGSLIVDDIQDGSRTRRGAPALHHIYDIPLSINAGCWLYFWSFSLLGKLLVELVGAEVQSEILQRANVAMLNCHQGQAVDLATRVYGLAPADLPAAVATSTGLKTGVLMEFAAFLGARASGADSQRCALLGRFGHRVGVGLQMLDDLGCVLAESRRHKATEDLVLARLTWPWAWLVQNGADREPQHLESVASWQERAREIAETDDREAAMSLILDLAGAIGSYGRRRVSDHLTAALAELRAVFGESVHLSAMEAELTRLERSYG